jgi:hypothetical protein
MSVILQAFEVVAWSIVYIMMLCLPFQLIRISKWIVKDGLFLFVDLWPYIKKEEKEEEDDFWYWCCISWRYNAW